jgi:hypothetical protein
MKIPAETPEQPVFLRGPQTRWEETDQRPVPGEAAQSSKSAVVVSNPPVRPIWNASRLLKSGECRSRENIF